MPFYEFECKDCSEVFEVRYHKGKGSRIRVGLPKVL